MQLRVGQATVIRPSSRFTAEAREPRRKRGELPISEISEQLVLLRGLLRGLSGSAVISEKGFRAADGLEKPKGSPHVVLS
jgi:hypothetical protein